MINFLLSSLLLFCSALYISAADPTSNYRLLCTGKGLKKEKITFGVWVKPSELSDLSGNMVPYIKAMWNEKLGQSRDSVCQIEFFCFDVVHNKKLPIKNVVNAKEPSLNTRIYELRAKVRSIKDKEDSILYLTTEN